MVETAAPSAEDSVSEAPVYFSHEVSLLQFDERVLDQAVAAVNPLLERVKFLAISDSNLDEFLSIHFSNLLGKVEDGSRELTPDGLTQTEQLTRVRECLVEFMLRQRQVFHEELEPKLVAAGIRFRRYEDLTEHQQRYLHDWFMREVFPVCTPLAVDPTHPFPFISNMSLNLAVGLWDARAGRSFARIKVPNVLPRLIRLPSGRSSERDIAYVWLEDIMAKNVGVFFPGIEVREVSLFRVVRHADIELQELEATDLREEVQAGVRRRRFGAVVAVQLTEPLPRVIEEELIQRLDVYPEDVFVVGGPLGLRDLFPLTDIDRPDLKDPPLVPRVPLVVSAAGDFFALLRQRDVLLNHPFESFNLVYDFVAHAAKDPDVLAIKQTLYRVGRRSPIIQSLLDAVDRGKQVAVLVEIQARGDEENNIEWAEALEQAGAHISYGVIGLKTHAKVSLVVRRESDGLRRYVHLGTGNYNNNPYVDLSFFTSNPEIGSDATELFNVLTGYGHQDRYKRLLVAPVTMRTGIIERIEREIERHQRHGDGHLIFKTNALIDLPVIDALYRASGVGVQVDLIVRGMCSLRPGIPGRSETIRVRSIVGRFLEHSRVYYFHNGGKSEVYIGSADLMERNLSRRVETLAPVLDHQLARALRVNLLDAYLADTVRATELTPDGDYRPIQPRPGDQPYDVQQVWASGNLSLMHG